jgi:hypothetical protein
MEDKKIKAIGKDIRTITSKIEILNKEKEEAEIKMKTVMKAVVDEMSKEHMDSKRVGNSKNMYVMKFSELISSKSWSSEYYNWEKQSEILFAYLEKESPLKWESMITELLKNENPMVNVKINKHTNTEKYRMNKEFLKRVLDIVWGVDE